MTLKEIQDWSKQYVKVPKLDIIVLDYASLYPQSMRTMDPTFIRYVRKQNRKRKIKKIFEPS
jgi:DNA polymerase elongation subunit (family B)